MLDTTSLAKRACSGVGRHVEADSDIVDIRPSHVTIRGRWHGGGGTAGDASPGVSVADAKLGIDEAP
jgi:hypothetical protein